MVEKKGYFQPGFASTIETVSELGALAEKLAFLIRSKLWLQILVCMLGHRLAGVSGSCGLGV